MKYTSWVSGSPFERRRGKLLGTLFSDVTVEAGQTKDLGNLTVKPLKRSSAAGQVSQAKQPASERTGKARIFASMIWTQPAFDFCSFSPLAFFVSSIPPKSIFAFSGKSLPVACGVSQISRPRWSSTPLRLVLGMTGKPVMRSRMMGRSTTSTEVPLPTCNGVRV